ncbi:MULTISPECIES: hypothetical protein [Cupriavidus]|uniref:hypothetical protein n=1 Tax=Cupriavidus TaxID=106589 RepID=UPI0009B82081|nr:MULTISPECIES: hypothetical protein [Cupriavidus]
MANGWTPERRAKQAEAIRRWSPWKQSTGPRTAAGKATASKNAWNDGQREKLRELSRLINADIHAARELVNLVSAEAVGE